MKYLEAPNKGNAGADQESFGFVVRALDYGGVVFEDHKPNTLAEAMAALEKGLAEYFKREGIELDE